MGFCFFALKIEYRIKLMGNSTVFSFFLFYAVNNVVRWFLYKLCIARFKNSKYNLEGVANGAYKWDTY